MQSKTDRRKSVSKGDYLIKTISQNDRGHFNRNIKDSIILYVINWMKFTVWMFTGGACFILIYNFNKLEYKQMEIKGAETNLDEIFVMDKEVNL